LTTDRYATIRLEVLPASQRTAVAELHVIVGNDVVKASIGRSFAEDLWEGVVAVLKSMIVTHPLAKHLADDEIVAAIKSAECVRRIEEGS